MTSQVLKIRKRDGRIVDFEPHKIENAIKKAMAELSVLDEETAKKIENIIKIINSKM